MPANLTYAQLLEVNEYIRKNSDSFYRQCTTRTVQESKLFPVSPYILLSYFNCFYRYPQLFRKIEEVMSAEELGDRCRDATMSANHISGSVTPQFYLLGREELIAFGLLKPTDAVEDVAYVLDFWKRFMLSYKRNDAHILNSDFNDRNQQLPERQLQVFEADAWGVTPGDRLHTAVTKFLAQVSQYCFLTHCECRLGIHNQGPYRIDDNKEMILREFVDLAEGDYPWLDGVADAVPYNNLSIPVVMKDTHFHIVDDWASFEAAPGYDSDNIMAVGLYTSDYLSDGYQPVGMDSPEKLAETLENLREVLQEATTKLWKVIAGWSRDQMLDAGALVYSSVPKDFAHIAGVYDPADWFEMEPRTQRFKPLMNDDYGQNALAELVGLLTLPTQQVNRYAMGKWSNQSSHMQQLFPYSVLIDEEYTASAGAFEPGTTSLPSKTGPYQTTRGKMTLEQVNAAARDFTPKGSQEPFKYLDDQWIKFNFDRPEAAELYHHAQRESRNLEGKGAGLTGRDLEDIRDWDNS